MEDLEVACVCIILSEHAETKSVSQGGAGDVKSLFG